MGWLNSSLVHLFFRNVAAVNRNSSYSFLYRRLFRISLILFRPLQEELFLDHGKYFAKNFSLNTWLSNNHVD